MEIDTVILSKTSDLQHYGLTYRTINSLTSSNGWKGSITLVESEKELDFKQGGYSYLNCDVIFPECDFGYNKFLNIGIEHTKSEWIMICNNDLFFSNSWFKEMETAIGMNEGILSFSPKCPHWHKHTHVGDGVFEGYEVSSHICGWCIVFHRSLLEKCDLFDEQFEFWYQDNDYSESLKSQDIRHALIGGSKVYHMVSGSHDLLSDKAEILTHGQQERFIKKWK